VGFGLPDDERDFRQPHLVASQSIGIRAAWPTDTFFAGTAGKTGATGSSGTDFPHPDPAIRLAGDGGLTVSVCHRFGLAAPEPTKR
jgi:hypothetical protein